MAKADKCPSVKRVKAPATLKLLKEQAAAFAFKCGINSAIAQIVYKEDKKVFVDVDDEDDFQLGMAQALHTRVPPEITFVVKFEKSTV